MKFALFDLDGTLNEGPSPKALSFVERHPKNWKAFFEELETAKVKKHIERKYHSYEHKKMIMTARGTAFKATTLYWLYKHGFKDFFELRMRPIDDKRPSPICKRDMMKQVIRDHGMPEIVYEDREDVVEVFKELKIPKIILVPTKNKDTT
jgi:FMN phosphatase YigB (HAD superfamily)